MFVLIVNFLADAAEQHPAPPTLLAQTISEGGDPSLLLASMLHHAAEQRCGMPACLTPAWTQPPTAPASSALHLDPRPGASLRLHLCAGTLTRNDMSVVRLWLAGDLHPDPVWLPTSTRPSLRDDLLHPSWSDALQLDAGLAQVLCRGVALNSTASIRLKHETSEWLCGSGSFFWWGLGRWWTGAWCLLVGLHALLGKQGLLVQAASCIEHGCACTCIMYAC